MENSKHDVPYDSTTSQVGVHPPGYHQSQIGSCQNCHAAYVEPNSPREYTWKEDWRRNKPQIKSLEAATLIFISGGMSLAWSIGGKDNFYTQTDTMMQVCWFLSVIIGVSLSTILINKLTKRRFNCASSMLVIVNGILFIAVPENNVIIALARFCDGLAFGLTIIPAIIAGSEQSIPRFRGNVLSAEQKGLAIGIVIRSLYSQYWQSNWPVNSNQMHGILALICGGLAVLSNVYQTIETATFYLRQGKEAEAIDSLRRLQVPPTVTNETYAALDENKHLLEEDAARGRDLNIRTGLMPLAKLCLYRVFVSMSFSLPLTVAFQLVSDSFEILPDFCFLYAIARMIGITSAVSMTDRLGRQIPSALALLSGGVLLILIGIFYSNILFAVGSQGHKVVTIFILLLQQVCAGIAAPASTCFLGEAFSISVKPVFILTAIVLENVVQIMVCCLFDGSIFSYACIVGILQMVYFIIFIVTVPETKQTTLRQALEKFKA